MFGLNEGADIVTRIAIVFAVGCIMFTLVIRH